jgi:hypothetical protein
MIHGRLRPVTSQGNFASMSYAVIIPSTDG